LFIDLGPVALFVISSNLLARFPQTKDNAIYIATGLFIVATLAAIAYCRWKIGRIPPALIVVGFLVVGFGGLTLALHDETFIKLRPTVANVFYSAAILISLALRQNVMKVFFGHVFVLPDRIWTIFALRWAGFFAFMAVIAEFIRRTMTTADWINWHFPLLYAPTLIFIFLNAPMLLKHQIEEEPQNPAPPAEAD
jgi:intracellular septation protein